jgi:zinc transporter, ZIP family
MSHLIDFVLVVAVSGVAALMSLGGGWLALHKQPTTLFLSITLGLAGGVLLGAIAFEMVPRATELSSRPTAIVGFSVGVLMVYAFELLVQRGHTAGIHAAQRNQIRHFHRQRPPAGDEVTVLAGGTAAEELIEGLSIGVGVAIEPRLALIVGVSIALDNLSEALSIGALIAERDGGTARSPAARRRALIWTSAIGGALFGGSVVSWLLLRSVNANLLGLLIAVGAGRNVLSVRDRTRARSRTSALPTLFRPRGSDRIRCHDGANSFVTLHSAAQSAAIRGPIFFSSSPFDGSMPG